MSKSASASRQQTSSEHVAILVAAVCAVVMYLGISLWQAAHRPLNMDEVMTLWVVRMPGVRDIYQTLLRGGQYEPPAHPVLLHALAKVAGQSYLVLRLPSILALVITAVAMGALGRRYVEPRLALLALILVLYSPLHGYAIEARPYTLGVACFALALVLWDDLRIKPASLWRPCMIGLLLAAALALHFYCAMYFVCFAVLELLYAVRFRRLRIAVWGSLAGGALSAVLWLPLARSISAINRGDGGTRYYARPDAAHFVRSIHAILLGHLSADLLLVSCGAAVVVWARSGWKPLREGVSFPGSSEFPLLAIGIACALLPAVTFVFAREVSGTYNDRYVLGGVLGSVILLVVLVQRLPYRGWLLPAAALVLGTVSILRTQGGDALPELKAALSQSSGTEPVVMAEGKLFLEAQEYRELPSEQKGRLVYLTLPPGYALGDSTNEHQVEIWKAIRPSLPVYPVQTYLRKGTCLELFDSGVSADDVASYLKNSGAAMQVLAVDGQARLWRVCS